MHFGKNVRGKKYLFIDKQYSNTDLYFTYVKHPLYTYNTLCFNLYAEIHLYTLSHFKTIFFVIIIKYLIPA